MDNIINLKDYKGKKRLTQIMRSLGRFKSQEQMINFYVKKAQFDE